MSLNSMVPARTAARSLLRCQSMPASQTGQRVLCQTVRRWPVMINRMWAMRSYALLALANLQHVMQYGFNIALYLCDLATLGGNMSCKGAEIISRPRQIPNHRVNGANTIFW